MSTTAEAPARTRFARLAAARRFVAERVTPSGREKRHQDAIGKVYSALVEKLKTGNPWRSEGIGASEDNLRLDYYIKGKGPLIIIASVGRGEDLPEKPSEISVHFSYGRNTASFDILRDEQGKFTIDDWNNLGKRAKTSVGNRRRFNELVTNQLPQV